MHFKRYSMVSEKQRGDNLRASDAEGISSCQPFPIANEIMRPLELNDFSQDR